MKNKNFSFLKYILFNLLKPFLTISLVLTGVVWLSRSLKYIDLIINKGLSLGSYFWFVSLIAPKILALLLPLISFATIVYAYQKLKADSELIVMESFGISKFTLMIPALIFGVIASVILLFIEAYLSPSNYKTFKAFQSDLRNNFVISSLQEGSFHNPITGLTVFIDKIAKDGTVNNILIHDPVRPCVTKTELKRMLEEFSDSEFQALILAVPVSDTLKLSKENTIKSTISREDVWRALTPQLFSKEVLKNAYNLNTEDLSKLTDEASLFDNLDEEVMIMKGSSENIKITFQDDLKLAKNILLNQKRI